jgi:hypothetical protein
LVHKAKWEYFRVSQELEKELLAMSARQMDRRCRAGNENRSARSTGRPSPEHI